MRKAASPACRGDVSAVLGHLRSPVQRAAQLLLLVRERSDTGARRTPLTARRGAQASSSGTC